MEENCFLDLNEVYEVMYKANAQFPVQFKEILFVDFFTESALKVHAAFDGRRGLTSSAFSVYKLAKNNIVVFCDNKKLSNDCPILKECVLNKLAEKESEEQR